MTFRHDHIPDPAPFPAPASGMPGHAGPALPDRARCRRPRISRRWPCRPDQTHPPRSPGALAADPSSTGPLGVDQASIDPPDLDERKRRPARQETAREHRARPGLLARCTWVGSRSTRRRRVDRDPHRPLPTQEPGSVPSNPSAAQALWSSPTRTPPRSPPLVDAAPAGPPRPLPPRPTVRGRGPRPRAGDHRDPAAHHLTRPTHRRIPPPSSTEQESP